MSTREEYALVFQSRFEEWDRRVNEIMEKMKHADPETKNDLNGQLEKIHALRQQAKENMEVLIDQNESAWEHLKDELEEIWEKVEKAFEKMIG